MWCMDIPLYVLPPNLYSPHPDPPLMQTRLSMEAHSQQQLGLCVPLS